MVQVTQGLFDMLLPTGEKRRARGDRNDVFFAGEGMEPGGAG
jgi:hypothetical protein